MDEPSPLTLRAFLGRVEIKQTADPAEFSIQAFGYIGPMLLRRVLPAARDFGERHPEGWVYKVDTSKVVLVNPVNFFWLMQIRKLPNLAEHVVTGTSRVTEFVIWLGRRIGLAPQSRKDGRG